MDKRLTHAWQVLYPPLQCHAQGWLEVGDGHQVHWEECGNPLGRPALFIHGGPGAGRGADDRRWFDPQRYRIVLLDQRGAGRSRPLGRLVANTTGHLVRDMEALRQHLHIERWLLFGGSWGATLALAYAQQHCDRVQALVLRGVFTAGARERHWLYSPEGAATLHPAAWLRLNAALATSVGSEGESFLNDPLSPWERVGVRASKAPPCLAKTLTPALSRKRERGQDKSQQHALTVSDLLGAMAAQLHCGDAPREQAAAQAWLGWEQALMEGEPPRPRDPTSTLAMARIGVHFARHAYFLEEGQLLTQAARLNGVPGHIVQGDQDQVTPPAAALALHRAWPGSRLQQIEDAGHASSHPGVAWQLIQATDHFSAPENGGARRHAGTHPSSKWHSIAAPFHGKGNV